MTKKPTTALIIIITVFFSTLAAGYASKIAPFRFIQNTSTTMTSKQDVFSVSGEATIETIPDEAQVSLGISTTSQSVSVAQTTINSTINSITEAIIALGIKKDDIKTSNYSIYPDYDYSSSARTIRGYRASATIRVTTSDFDLLNQLIDTATSLGANEVGNVSFALSTAREKEVLKEAREQAIADAKQNAQELARLSGMTLGDIINIRESNFPSYSPIYLERSLMSAQAFGEDSASTDIQSGTANYDYRVTLEFDVLQ